LTDYRVPPVTDFQYQPQISSAYTVTFTNTVRGLPPVTYTWNFGDGSPPLGTGTARISVQHTYTAAGRYTVTLTATNAFGADAVSRTLTIVSPRFLYLPLVMK